MNRWRYSIGLLLLGWGTGCFEAVDDQDGDGWLRGADCDDGDRATHPGATEVCDGIDNNCDGAIDESAVDAVLYYDDLDGDGYGNSASLPIGLCAPRDGMAPVGGDCDDSRSDRTPETVWYIDADGDRYGDADGEQVVDCWGPAGFADNGLDCDDGAAAVHPGAEERCNGLDDDCDAAIDEDNHQPFYEDKDGDGFGNSQTWDDSVVVQACEAPDGFVADATDCDDDNPYVNPDSERICGDGIDNACDAELGRDIAQLECVAELEDSAVRIIGAQEEEAFGARIGVVRDLYGTDDDALVVGAMGHRRDNDVETGAVWIFQMSALMDASTTDGWVEPAVSGVLVEGVGSSQLSSGIGPAGDVDGDGIVDLALGAHLFDTQDSTVDVVPDQDGYANSGALFVIPGSVLRTTPPGGSLDVTEYLWAYGGFTADWLGSDVRSGDLNGDGIADVIAGATGMQGTDSTDGGVLDKVGGFAVVFGIEGTAEPAPISMANLEASGRGVRLLGVDGSQLSVGQSVASGDLTGDGIDDLVVGVLREDSERGGVYIVSGPLDQDASLNDVADAHLQGADANGSFGSQVRVVPPTSGCDDSGYPTVYVVASSTSEGMPRQAGALYSFDFSGVLPGEVGSAPSISRGRIQGATPDRRLGRSVAVNGWIDDADCHPDLLLSAWPDSGADLRGHAMVFLGPVIGVQEESDHRAMLFGEEAYARAGEALAFARAPSLMTDGAYPGARDAVVVGSDRFDRDADPAILRENAGSVHIMIELGY